MSKRDVAKFHKLLESDEPNKNISAILGVSKETLEKFMPKKAEVTKTK